MVFDRVHQADMNPDDLIGIRWVLVTMDGVSPMKGFTLTLYFESGGTFGGHAGCRDFSGEYQAEGDQIVFPSMGMSGDDSCLSDQAVFDQEHNYIDYISSARNYVLEDGQLTMMTPRGEIVVFSQAGE